MTPSQTAKQDRILECALKLLRENGDAGLTMRKLAECAGMRLSNVQYYFRSKDDVLEHMVVLYAGRCQDDLKRAAGALEAQSPQARARALIDQSLQHGAELSHMCRIFRELWAISSRNPRIEEAMAAYYAEIGHLLVGAILGDLADQPAKDRLQSLLLPYFEGYSITAAALPMATEDVAELLTALAMNALD
ncbi:MAG: TetR/AcrR family transcriptional regulator [Pseudomonadota bacterium]